jgi:hypothetical protein
LSLRDNHHQIATDFLIQIVALFSPRLSRYKQDGAAFADHPQPSPATIQTRLQGGGRYVPELLLFG